MAKSTKALRDVPIQHYMDVMKDLVPEKLISPKHSLSKLISETSCNCSGAANAHLYQYKLSRNDCII